MYTGRGRKRYGDDQQRRNISSKGGFGANKARRESQDLNDSIRGAIDRRRRGSGASPRCRTSKNRSIPR